MESSNRAAPGTSRHWAAPHPLKSEPSGGGAGRDGIPMHVPQQSARVWALAVRTPGWECFVPSLEMQDVLVKLHLGGAR